MAGDTVHLRCSLFTVVLCVIFNSSNARPELNRGRDLPEEFPKTCGYDVRRIFRKFFRFHSFLIYLCSSLKFKIGKNKGSFHNSLFGINIAKFDFLKRSCLSNEVAE